MCPDGLWVNVPVTHAEAQQSNIWVQYYFTPTIEVIHSYKFIFLPCIRDQTLERNISCLTWQQLVLHSCLSLFTISVTSLVSWGSRRLATPAAGYQQCFVHKHLNWRQVMELVPVTHSTADINTWRWKQLGNSAAGLQNKNKSHQLHKLKNGRLPAVEGRRDTPALSNLFLMLQISRYWERIKTCCHYLHLPINNCRVVGICSQVQEDPPLESQFFHSFLVSHIYITGELCYTESLSGRIVFLTQAVTNTYFPLLCFNEYDSLQSCTHWTPCNSCHPLNKIKY